MFLRIRSSFLGQLDPHHCSTKDFLSRLLHLWRRFHVAPLEAITSTSHLFPSQQAAVFY